MIRLRGAAVAASVMLALVTVGAFACGDVSGSSTSVLSIQFDSLRAPSVVVGDTLRDTTGAVIVPVVHAFNFRGDEIIPAPVWFQSPDSGISVDSLTGIVVADSLRSTSARIVATVGSLQAIQKVDVTLRPDLIAAVTGLDSLSLLAPRQHFERVAPARRQAHPRRRSQRQCRQVIHRQLCHRLPEQSTARPTRERCREAICCRYHRRQRHSGKSDSSASSLPHFRGGRGFNNRECDREVSRC